MPGLLERSRIPVPIVPRDVVAALLERGIEPGEEIVLPADSPVAETALRPWLELLALWRRIPFTMQHQTQSNWCWAAVSVSVARYYTRWTRWTQCRMAGAELGQSTCCADGSTSACNQPNVLDSPLRRAGVLDHMEFGDAGMAAIRSEIDAGRPLCWRIGWSGGGGHFAVIEGYRLIGSWVAVDDPWYGASDVPLATLTGGTYQGSGDWTHTYYTRRPPFHFPTLWGEQELRWPAPADRPVAIGGGGD